MSFVTAPFYLSNSNPNHWKTTPENRSHAIWQAGPFRRAMEAATVHQYFRQESIGDFYQSPYFRNKSRGEMTSPDAVAKHIMDVIK